MVQLPAAVSAADVQAAILRSNGAGVSVNNSAAPTSIALFPDDYIQTNKGAVARLEISGSTVDISGDTIVQFEGDELVLDHGRLSVHTTNGLRVRVGCLVVIPVNLTTWTQYDVADVDSKLTVSALKSDVNIDQRSKEKQAKQKTTGSNRATVLEGEEKSRTDHCGAAYINEGIAAKGALLNATWVRMVGAVVIGVVACLGLCHTDDPLSPSNPN